MNFKHYLTLGWVLIASLCWSQCDDGNPCTFDFLDAEEQCQHEPLCFDNDPCTIDLCFDGECFFLTIQPGMPCDDGDFGTTGDVYTESCECKGTPVPNFGCNEPLACNYDPEAIFNSGCIFSGQPCDDGNGLTIGDVYTNDCLCEGQPIVVGCTNLEACNFDPDATISGPCDFVGSSCDDGNNLTINDVYDGECMCTGELVIWGCTDSAACNWLAAANTDDGSCSYVGQSCDDGDACTLDDKFGADCQCNGTPKNCDDGDSCTFDSCNSETGECSSIPYWEMDIEENSNLPCYILCQYVVEDMDGNPLSFGLPDAACEVDTVMVREYEIVDVQGTVECAYRIRFQYSERNCDDGDPCTTDFCDESTGCVHVPIFLGTACDDGNDLTVNDTYHEGCLCVGELIIVGCTDETACNYDPTASVNFGCLYVGTSCDDGNPCTENDKINEDCSCAGTPKSCDDSDPCTFDSCDPETGECLHIPYWEQDIAENDTLACYILCQYVVETPDGTPLSFGLPTSPCTVDTVVTREYQIVDAMDNLECAYNIRFQYSMRNCDDGNPCTVDTCEEGVGCVHTPKNCDDGDLCTLDLCDPETGNCLHIIQECDDGDDCTYDSCDPETGQCVHTPVWIPFISNYPDPKCMSLCGYRVKDADGSVIDDQSFACLDAVVVSEPLIILNDAFINPEATCSLVVELLYEPLYCLSDDDPCTADICDPESGQCIHKPIWEVFIDDFQVIYPCRVICGWDVFTPDGNLAFSYTDQNGCDATSTHEEHLQVNDLITQEVLCEFVVRLYLIDVECDDGDPCTWDTCNPETGECLHLIPEIGFPCDDGNPETVNDVYNENCICEGEVVCPEDLNGDGAIGTADLLEFLNSFGTDCDD